MNMELNFQNSTALIFVLSFLVQLFYYLYFFIRLSFKDKNDDTIEYNYPPLSIIIAARNEEENLTNNLPLLFKQDYPEFQVVVVNDRSWDASLDVLQAYYQKYENLKVVENPDVGKDGFAKKFAITLGIKAADYDKLVFIDADCVPSSNQWLKEIVKGFSNNKQIVLGAGPYERTKGFLNKLIRFDANFIAVQYLSFAKAKNPYMGVGRNLAYTQEIYDSVRGFKNHYYIPSGDDDLFVNETASKKNTAVVFNENALTFSKPKDTFKSWFYQKKRHISTGKHYKFKDKVLLTLYPFSLLIFYISLILLMVIHNWWYIALSLAAFRMLLQILIFIRPFKIFKSKDLLLMLPIWEIIMLFLAPVIMINNKIHKVDKWT